MARRRLAVNRFKVRHKGRVHGLPMPKNLEEAKEESKSLGLGEDVITSEDYDKSDEALDIALNDARALKCREIEEEAARQTGIPIMVFTLAKYFEPSDRMPRPILAQVREDKKLINAATIEEVLDFEVI